MGIFGTKREGLVGNGLGQGVTAEPLSAAQGGATVMDHDDTLVMDTPTATGETEASRIVDEVAPKSSGGLFRRNAKPTGAVEAKPVKAGKTPKAAKPPKAAKAGKATKEEVSAADDLRLSNQVLIEFYPDMSKQDTIALARHWALDHAKSPSNCSFMVMKVGDGYAMEVQDGVGRAYLPSVVKLAQDNPGRLIIVPMVRRKMTVYYSIRNEEFEAQILPERQEPPVMAENPPIYATRGPVMTPVTKQYREWLIAGASAAIIGGLSLLMSVGFYAFDAKSKIPPEWRTTDVAELPIMQWGRLQADASDSYVVRLEYENKQWRIVRQAVSASVDVSKPVADGSGVVAPATPGAEDAAPTAAGADAGASNAPANTTGSPAAAAANGGVNIPPPGPTGR